MTGTRTIFATNAPYFSEVQKNALLNPAKNFPKQKSQARVKRSFFAPSPLRRMAQSAGDSVSDTTAEIIVGTAIVSANCL